MWFYLHFPHMYGETWSQFQADIPVAIIRESGSEVEDCNHIARQQGVEKQMLLSTAFCLSPKLKVETIQPERMHQAQMRVARIGYLFSAWVGLEPPDGLYLEVASMQSLFGGLAPLRQHILDKFKRAHYTVVLAAAPFPKSARLLARSGAPVCITETRLPEVLKQISVDNLSLSEKVLERIHKLGIKTLFELSELPASDVAYRIEASLGTYLAQITGRQPWLPAPVKFKERFNLRVELEHEIETSPALIPLLSQAVKRYSLFLQNRCLASSTLTVFLIHRQQLDTVVPVQLASPDNRAEIWGYILRHTLEKVQLPEPVIAFALKGVKFEAVQSSSLCLFDGPSFSNESNPQKAKMQSSLLNRLSARIGMHNLHFVAVAEDPRPEFQTAFISEASSMTGSLAECPPNGSIDSTLTFSPAWLLHTPKVVNIRNYKVLYGPMRLDTGWWDQKAVRRDYYIAQELAKPQLAAALHWLYRTDQNQWYLHGLFS